jgi:betaine lipid synthase
VLLAQHVQVSGPVLGWSLAVLAWSLMLLGVCTSFRTPMVFMWNCFLKPFLKAEDKFDQKARLDAFYSGQADVYDGTRAHLLKGRETMLQLLSAHLKAQPVPVSVSGNAPKPKIWVDIGGGTGWNIEKMDEYLPHTYFDKIYLVDLCEPLLEVARKRFAAKGWKNVHCLCQDASRFVLPEWESGELDPRGSLTAITLSYSLSMIPPFYHLLDRCDQVLDPAGGLIGVVDFYTSRDLGIKERAIGTQSKRVSWFSKWFWECWFEFDNVHLHGSRRDYLEYKMGTIKTYNARNNFFNSWFVQIP